MAASLVGQRRPDEGQISPTLAKCGTPVDGIALCLSPAGGFNASLEVRNVGPSDAVLNLGVILANGAHQYPTAITLELIDEKSRRLHAKLAEPTGVIGGRIDPLIVPLLSGAACNFPIHLSNMVWHESGQIEAFEPDPKNHYALQARFTGRNVGTDEAAPDVKGITLLHFWMGTVVSNAATIGPK
jgi:hypothetical protein